MASVRWAAIQEAEKQGLLQKPRDIDASDWVDTTCEKSFSDSNSGDKYKLSAAVAGTMIWVFPTGRGLLCGNIHRPSVWVPEETEVLTWEGSGKAFTWRISTVMEESKYNTRLDIFRV
ncbi:hypothetical protein BBP40_004933 [Aspergillus hancockii]|nr:hypothetical protein BBP40_004933 [Aspergillus hancockii]